MIVVLVLPPVLAGAAWMLLPKSAPVSRGTLIDEVIFLETLKEPFPSDIRTAMDYCFVVGELESHYGELLAQANRNGPPTFCEPGSGTVPMGRQYVFWCEGKNPTVNGDAWVVVIVDGNPSRITHTWVGFAKTSSDSENNSP